MAWSDAARRAAAEARRIHKLAKGYASASQSAKDYRMNPPPIISKSMRAGMAKNIRQMRAGTHRITGNQMIIARQSTLIRNKLRLSGGRLSRMTYVGVDGREKMRSFIPRKRK